MNITSSHPFGSRGPHWIEVIIIVAIIGLLAGIAVPHYAKTRATARKNACVENLRLLKVWQDSYAREYALPTGIMLSDMVIERLLKTGKNCPAGGMYTINAVGADPACSFPGHISPRKTIKDP